MASLVAQMVKHLPAVGGPRFDLWVGKILWRRKWQPTSVLLPGKFHVLRSLIGYSLWGCKESDTTEQLHFHFLYGSLTVWKESYNKPRQSIKKQRHQFADKGPYSQSYGFSSNCVRMWELDHKEGWMLKNGCFQIMVLRRLLRVPWTARRSSQSILKEINPEHSLEVLMFKLKLH